MLTEKDSEKNLTERTPSVDKDFKRDGMQFNGANLQNNTSGNRTKRKKRQRVQSGGVFVVIIVVLSFAVTVLACGILNGGIMKGIVLGESNNTFYLLSMGDYDDLTLAKQASVTNKKQGGAGYVLNYCGKYRLIASIYRNRADAEKVQSKQQESAEIIEATLQKFSGLESWHSQGEKALDGIVKCYETLGDIIVKRVCEEMEVIESKNKLLLLLGNMINIQSEFEKAADCDAALNFNARLEAAVSMIEELRKGECPVSGLRYLQIAVIVMFCNS